MSDPKAIAITGAGVLTAAGQDISTIWKICDEEMTFTSPEVPGFPARDDERVAALPTPNPEASLRDRKTIKYMDKMSRIAVQATVNALQNAGLDLSGLDPYRIAIYMAIDQVSAELSDLAPVVLAARTASGECDVSALGKNSRINPLTVFKTLSNIPICNISIGLGIKGENLILYPAPTQAARALEEGIWALREDRASVVLAGSVAQPVNFLGLHTLAQAGTLGYGPPPADGAGVLILETAAHAVARGARVLGWVRSFGESFGAWCAGNEEEAVAACAAAMTGALEDLDPASIDLVILGSANTKQLEVEQAAVQKVFAGRVPALLHPWERIGDTRAARFPLGACLALEAIRRGCGRVMVNAVDDHGACTVTVLERGFAE